MKRYYIKTLLLTINILLLPYIKAEELDSKELKPCGNVNNIFYCNCDDEIEEETPRVICYAVKPEDPAKVKAGERPEWRAISRLVAIQTFDLMVMQSKTSNMSNMQYFPPPEVFKDMKKLEFVKISSADLSNDIMPPHAFYSSLTLREIQMNDNGIRKLSPYAFANLISLTEISLSGNQIESIERDVFFNLPKLKTLYLQQNSIDIIHDEAFRHLENLETLELQTNNITFINPEVFAGLINLKRIDLGRNQINLLGDRVFERMSNLEDLDLTDNFIISVTPTAFHGLKKLGRLNLKGNKIVELVPGTFLPLNRIYFLDVRDNELETFSKDLISDVYRNFLDPSMQLWISGNRFVCDCRLTWMSKLFNETQSTLIKDHLAKTSCDVPSPTSIMEEKELHFKVHEQKTLENVTLIAGPIEDTTIYSTGSTISVVLLRNKDLKCQTDKPHRTRGTHNRGRNKDLNKSFPENEKRVPEIEERTQDAVISKTESPVLTSESRNIDSTASESKASVTSSSSTTHPPRFLFLSTLLITLFFLACKV